MQSNTANRRLEIAEAMLQVMEHPTKERVIIKTDIPNLAEPWEDDSTIYYMVDKSDAGTSDCGEIYSGWLVCDNAGNGTEFPTTGDVLRFFDRLNVPATIEVTPF